MALFDAIVTSPDMDEAFSDAAILSAMLRFEAALALAEARARVIPGAAADAIAAVSPAAFDSEAIARKARASATPAIAFVETLTAAVASAHPSAAAYVHYGATSQDVTDTALVLCLRRAQNAIDALHARIDGALRRLSKAHASSVMLGRTLLQPAPPTTFGLKAAGWLGSLSRSHQGLTEAFARSSVLQFGGASGTLAALHDRGLEVAQYLSRELDLTLPDAPWHAHRDRLAFLVSACGVYAGAIGKAARDIALLMQAEVAEASEPGGTSSTMPHKRNPAGCAVALAAASRLPGLVATFLAGMAQEHERGVGGGQAEWATVATAVVATGSAASALAGVVEGLRVDPERMRQAIAESHGAVFSERAMMRLAPVLGRDVAARLVAGAVAAAARGESFASALLADPEAAAALTDHDRATLESPETYLGLAEQFRRRLTGGLE
ncbi:MAG TPA: lyase family protein [Vicinamibacterales bacterium]|nr:lyase family protein [Vicinamibacterales bacterium]